MKQVSKNYHVGETIVVALKGIDLDIKEGEFIAIWGPSGSGKSTLCNLLGLIDNPTSGTIKFQGQDIIHLSDDEKSELRNNVLGFVFQSFNLIPVLSALENVMLPLQIQGKSVEFARDKAEKLLDELGLSAHIMHRPDKLSGGQQQRVAIARALITDPGLILADEPTANIDTDNALKIVNLMRELNKTRGTTFIFSTHDQRLLDQVQRRIQLLDGLILEDVSV
ncbi:ABC transporter ATP-binding protein [Thermodesulfobacteriota bacterium]